MAATCAAPPQPSFWIAIESGNQTVALFQGPSRHEALVLNPRPKNGPVPSTPAKPFSPAKYRPLLFLTAVWVKPLRACEATCNDIETSFTTESARPR